MAEPGYADKVVVITGASSGFGRGTALELAGRGASVVLAARDEEALQDVAAECEHRGGKALVVPTDTSDRASIENLASEALAQFKQVNVWINNAGVASIGRFDAVPLEDHIQVIKTDLLGTIAGSYFALQHFRERGSGTLINVASVVGKIPAPLYASYVAAKFGVVGLGDALRQELSDDDLPDVRVCTVTPMAHDTEFFEHAGNYTGRKAVPIPPSYDPSITIDKLVELVIEPEDEVITGWQGGVFNFLHRLFPDAVEAMMASNTEKAQLEDAPSGHITSGTVHRTAK